MLTVCNNIGMKNVIKCLHQLNHRGILTTILGILFSFNRICCLLFTEMINFDIQLFLPNQSALSININSPIRKLLVSINQCLILLLSPICNFIYTFFDKAKETNMYEIKSRRIVKGIDVDDTANLQDLRKKI